MHLKHVNICFLPIYSYRNPLRVCQLSVHPFKELKQYKKATADAKSSILDALRLELDVETLKDGLKSAGQKIKVDGTRLLIAWYGRYDNNIRSKKTISKLKKDDLLEELMAIIKRLADDFCVDDYRYIQLPQDVGVSITEEWDEVEDREDADMMEG